MWKIQLVILLTFIMLLNINVQIAQASLCRQYGEEKICLLEVKRSAKKYWEYRAIVSVNGQVKPREIYNCRNKFRIQKDGNVVPFEQNGAGELICSILTR